MFSNTITLHLFTGIVNSVVAFGTAIFSTLDFWRDLHKTYRARFSTIWVLCFFVNFFLFFFVFLLLNFYYNFMFKLFVVFAMKIYIMDPEWSLYVFVFVYFFFFSYSFHVRHKTPCYCTISSICFLISSVSRKFIFKIIQ